MSTYSLAAYAGMLHDGTRMPAYLEAMQRVIKPGSIVLDLGAGFGYFALVACKLGAGRVYAVEPASSINQLTELARINGFADRIVALSELSTRITLPERVDVVVADIRGVLPVIGGSLRTMIDARDRLMAKGGTMLPWRDRLVVAPVEDRASWNNTVNPWVNQLHAREATSGLNLEPIRELLKHSWRSREIIPSSLLAPGKVWAEVDYHTNTATDLEGATEFSLSESGVVHGLGSWFEAEIMPGIRYSSGPDNLPTVYGSAFLPMAQPLYVQSGDKLAVRISLIDIGGDYHLRWRTKLVREGQVLASFDQGDFFQQALDLERLKQRLPGSVPVLKPEGQLARVVLEGAQAGRNIGKIAETLLETFPGRFEDTKQAIDYAARTLERLNG